MVYSKELPEAIGAAIDHIEDWPKWHFQLERARLTDAKTIRTGAHIEWILKPREWKTSIWQIEVRDYQPGHKIRLAFVSDNPPKLERTLKDIEWTVERLPETPDGLTPIRGRVTARTASGRARLLSLVAEKVILNQLFYPDLAKFQFDLSATHHHPAFDPPAESR